MQEMALSEMTRYIENQRVYDDLAHAARRVRYKSQPGIVHTIRSQVCLVPLRDGISVLLRRDIPSKDNTSSIATWDEIMWTKSELPEVAAYEIMRHLGLSLDYPGRTNRDDSCYEHTGSRGNVS